MGELTPAGEDTCAVCGAIDEALVQVRPLEAGFGRLGEEPPPEGWPLEWWCGVCRMMYPYESVGGDEGT